MSKFKSSLIACAGLISLLGAGNAVIPVSSQGRGPDAVREIVDSDGDGVADRRDACPSTPAQAQILAEGCSALDIVTNPGAVLDRAVEGAAAARAALDTRTFPELGDVVRLLSDALSHFDAASDLLGDGDVCKGATVVRRAVLSLERARRRMSELVPELQRQVAQDAARAPGVENGDASRFDIAWHELAADEAVVSQTLARVETTVRAVDGACLAVTGPLHIRGQVTKIDDSNRRIRFDNGTVVGLPANQTLEIAEGANLAAKGIGFADNTGVATNLSGGHLWKPGFFVPCMALQVAPLQPAFAPGQPGSVTLHSTVGYLHDGYLQLEVGTKLSVRDLSCPTSSPTPGGFWRYSMKIVAFYKKEANGPTLEKGLGEDVLDEELVSFPTGVALGTPVTLDTTIRRQHCITFANGNQCGPLETVLGQSHQAILFVRRAFCSANGEGVVALDDDPATDDFRTDHISVLKPSGVDGADSLSFEAEGYAVTFGTSSYPQVVPIGFGQNFAVYDDDFFEPDDFYSAEIHGVDGPSAVRWPRIKGTRNGEPFWYTCKVPTVIRDAVEFCSPGPHAFYKLPWSGVAKTTQGNNGALTHKNEQAFAFDFRMNMYDPIYATRGGTVAYVREDLWKTSNPHLVKLLLQAWEPANALKIRHQDDTYSWYFHMIQNTVAPEVNDIVKRGDVVASIGMTGNATGPHLHYQVNATPGPLGETGEWEQSMQIRYQAWIWLGVVPPLWSPCHIPVTGQLLESTK